MNKMPKQETMSLIQFQKQFATEKACHDHLFSMKWPEGYRCPRCGHDQYFQTNSRKLTLYECKQCRYQATVTVGTVMEKTRTDLRKWFWAIFLVAHDKRGVSASMLSIELEITYKTAWLMLHKIRKAMGERDTRYTLAGIVELDEPTLAPPLREANAGVVPTKRKYL